MLVIGRVITNEADAWQVAEMYVLQAYHENQLTEHMCSGVPWSTAIGAQGGPLAITTFPAAPNQPPATVPPPATGQAGRRSLRERARRRRSC